MMKTWGILWDMDGVLVDTGEWHYQTWRQILLERGITITYADFHKTFGMKNAELLPLWLGHPLAAEEIDRIGQEKEARFRKVARGQVKALPGVRTWLERFQAQGYAQAVASSAPPENIEMLMQDLDIERYFLAFVSTANLPGKPDPAVFIEAARHIAIPPERCIVIEDSVPGVEAARRAGMKCIAVTNTHPAAALGAANLIVEHLEDLSEAQLQALIEA
jgi:HAD superfamily hydrolase (TIGR01509 family)